MARCVADESLPLSLLQPLVILKSLNGGTGTSDKTAATTAARKVGSRWRQETWFWPPSCVTGILLNGTGRTTDSRRKREGCREEHRESHDNSLEVPLQ